MLLTRMATLWLVGGCRGGLGGWVGGGVVHLFSKKPFLVCIEVLPGDPRAELM